MGCCSPNYVKTAHFPHICYQSLQDDNKNTSVVVNNLTLSHYKLFKFPLAAQPRLHASGQADELCESVF